MGRKRRLAKYLYKVGEVDEAVKTIRECVQRQKEVIGEKHPDTLQSLFVMGEAVYQQGRVLEARAIFEDCFEKRIEMLGVSHPHTKKTKERLELVKKEKEEREEKVDEKVI